MMLLDLINLKKIRRALLYLLCMTVTLWLQTAVFSRVAPFGVKPFFVPVIAVAVGLWEGGVWGGVMGLVTGFHCDMAYGESSVTYLVLFAAFGFGAGLLGEFFINRRFVAFLLLSLAALAVTAVCQIFPLWAFRGVPLGTLFPVAVPQVLISLPFAVPAYFAVKAIAREKQKG